MKYIKLFENVNKLYDIIDVNDIEYRTHDQDFFTKKNLIDIIPILEKVKNKAIGIKVSIDTYRSSYYTNIDSFIDKINAGIISVRITSLLFSCDFFLQIEKILDDYFIIKYIDNIEMKFKCDTTQGLIQCFNNEISNRIDC